MTKIKQDDNRLFITLLFTAGFCACGIFSEYISAIFTVITAVFLTVGIIRKKQAKIVLSPVNILIMLIPLLYLVTSLWATDTGYAVFGFVKFLPVALVVPLFSDGEKNREAVFDSIPYTGIVMAVVSSVLMHVPALKGLLSVSDRPAGFFQYPNTYALFLLIGLLILLTKKELKKIDYITAVLLFGAILYSGSRTVAVLTVVFVVVTVFLNANKKVKIIIPSAIAGLIIVAVLYTLVSGNYDNIGRFMSISLSESTFVGRLLYYKDGLKILLDHPFGLGYMGYSFVRDSYQTGVYVIQYIHNEFLQTALDIGVQGLAVLLAAVAISFFSEKTDKRRRILMLAICAHCMLDFDLQFVSVYMLFALILCDTAGKTLEIRPKALAVAPLVLSVVFSGWLGLSQGLYHFKKYNPAYNVYPSNTLAGYYVMTCYDDAGMAVEIADKLLSQNEYLPLVYSKKAEFALENGNIEDMIAFKEKQISLAPYELKYYNEYCSVLVKAYEKSVSSGDGAMAELCKENLLSVPDMLEELKARTDELAFMIDDKPSFELDSISLDYISMMKEAEK